jgi:hypothetical protein
MLEVRLLGGLSAVVDGRPVELPADARARELLARLALAPGPQPRSALAGRLRPDVPEESARKTLRNALYELRRALGPAASDALAVSGDRIALSDAVHVDVREFRRQLAGGDLEAAAAAGHGRLLDGFDGDWVLRAREEHAAELAGVLGALAARAEAAGDLPAARRLGSAAPGCRAAGRGRAPRPDPPARARRRSPGGARCRARDGRASPLGAGDPAVGGDPSARRGRPPRPDRPRARCRRRGRPSPLPPALAAARHVDGRAPVLARLEQAWADAITGARRFALIAGEPGIGKTTLAGELARRARAQGGAVLLGRSDEHALVPFQPWIEALERLLEALPAADADHWLTAHDGALARLLPARSPAQASVAGQRDRYLAFELVRALLEETAARWPLLLVLDDVHWADSDSLSLLRHLARSGSRARLLVVLCARPAELEPASRRRCAELRREGPLVHVELAGSTTTRWPRCSRGARARATRSPRGACARAAAATLLPRRAAARRAGGRSGGQRSPGRGCATSSRGASRGSHPRR